MRHKGRALTQLTRPVVPWYNRYIDRAKRARRKAERKWMKMSLPSDFADYKKKRNYATNRMNKAIQEFYTQFVEENSSNQKKLFNAANKLLGGRKQLRFPGHANETLLANDIGRYFQVFCTQNRAHPHGHRFYSSLFTRSGSCTSRQCYEQNAKLFYQPQWAQRYWLE